MTKNKMEETVDSLPQDFELGDTSLELKEVEVNKEVPVKEAKKTKKIKQEDSKELVNCLRNERVIVRLIPKLTGIWGNNPKHVLSGGMSEGSARTFVVPKLASSGAFVNVLTDNEKAYLEEVMGLEYNALSVYKKVDNFWDDSNEAGIGKVRLLKQDNHLNLANPEDYIKYKILLANKDFIAPSLQELQDRPKATYQYVIVSEKDETSMAKTNMSSTMQCYKEFGKIENDKDILRVVLETIEGKPTSQNSKLEFLQTRINTLIQNDSKLFLKVVTDPLLNTKVLIKKSIEAGFISNRGNYLYLREDNTPLCESNEEPTLNIAAKYLNSPKHQDVLFMLQAKTK